MIIYDANDVKYELVAIRRRDEVIQVLTRNASGNNRYVVSSGEILTRLWTLSSSPNRYLSIPTQSAAMGRSGQLHILTHSHGHDEQPW